MLKKIKNYIKKLWQGLNLKTLLRGALFFFINIVVNFAVFVAFYLIGANIYVCQILSLAAKKFSDIWLTRKYFYKIKEPLTGGELKRFFLLLPFSMALSLFGIYFFGNVLGFSPLIAKLLSFACGGLFNGFWRSFIYFKGKVAKKHDTK